MSDLEKELGLAMRREAPPEGFAERVMARIAEEQPTIQTRRPRTRLAGLAALAAAAAIAVFAFGAWRAAAPTPDRNPSLAASDAPRVEAPPSAPRTETLAPAIPPPAARRSAPAKSPRRAVARRAAPRPEDPSVAEAQHAKEQLLLALRITSDSLETTRRLVVSSQ
jgi:hypothetical protein